MNKNTFYTDHWKQIEPERVNRYERMFAWRDEHIALLEPLDIRSGSRVLDFGCGPGFISIGLANLVGTSGRVYGMDLNKRFISEATRRAQNLTQVTFHKVENEEIPLREHAVNRLFCKNVLEYVPDVRETLQEFQRVLEPGGRLLIIDSDWRFVVVEPWGHVQTERFFSAASIAFKTPAIGRRLRTELMNVGFKDVEVKVQAGVDTTGGSLSVLRNMRSYIETLDLIAITDLVELMNEAEAAVRDGRYMFCLPQFIVSGRRS